MKIVFEDVKRDAGSSFRILVNPRLNDFFYWHFHPEYEITYIEGANGTRHVGEHIGQFEGSDLVFIGSNIPHLNFDFGIKTPYEKIVLQIKEDFLIHDLPKTPELTAIHALFEKARHAVCFHGSIKENIGPRLKRLPQLSHFEQFIEILSIFKALADTTEQSLLHPKPFENLYNRKEQQRIKQLYAFIEDNYQRNITVADAARLTNLTNAAFCRYFKKMTKLTFTEFLNQYRIDQAKKLLIKDKNVTETCYECGFESLSYFNRIFKKIVGENPMDFKKRFR
jgi:AraC-like DNA-binding protein